MLCGTAVINTREIDCTQWHDFFITCIIQQLAGLLLNSLYKGLSDLYMKARDANFTSLKSRKEHALRVRMWLRTMKTLFVLHSSSLLLIYVAKYELRFLLKSDTSYKRVKFSWFKVALPMCSTIKEILENVTCRLDLFLLYEILGFKDRKRGKSWNFHALCEKHLL